MCNFPPQISKTFFPIHKIFTKTFISLFGLKKKVIKKKGMGDTVTIFLKCIILNYFNERLVLLVLHM